MKFEQTILNNNTLTSHIVIPKNIPALLSFARSEYYHHKSSKNEYMVELQTVFNEIAHIIFKTKFVWSDYNIGQWEKFVSSVSCNGEGGAIVISMEPDGDYSKEIHDSFRALFIGVPTGMYPYSMWLSHPKNNPKLLSVIAGFDKYTLDLIADE